MNPRFSVLIPTYNRERLIGETIDSVLSQTFSSFELIAIDDGSTDGTEKVLASYGERIKILRQANQGPEAARRLAATVATGEYFVMLDSDDLLLPWALATYDRIIRECDAPALIVGLLTYFRDGEKPLTDAAHAGKLHVLKFSDYLAKKVPVGLSSSNIVVRKSVFERAGASRSLLKTFPMDTFHYVLMFGTFGPCVVVRAPYTVAYRVHQGNAIHNVAGMLGGIQHLVSAEHRGVYPGGRRRWFDRQACIGGCAWGWIVQGLRPGSIGLAVRTLIRLSPMVMAGALHKLVFRFHEAVPLICQLGENAEL